MRDRSSKLRDVNSQNRAWVYEPVADGSRFIISMPNQGSRPSAIDLLIGRQ